MVSIFISLYPAPSSIAPIILGSIKRIKIRFKDPSEKILGFSFEMHIDSSIVRSYSAPYFKWSDTLVKNLQFDYTDGSFGTPINLGKEINT